MTPKPIIGPRFARIRWANPPCELAEYGTRHFKQVNETSNVARAEYHRAGGVG
jgi:hypothetical protein